MYLCLFNAIKLLQARYRIRLLQITVCKEIYCEEIDTV